MTDFEKNIQQDEQAAPMSRRRAHVAADSIKAAQKTKKSSKIKMDTASKRRRRQEKQAAAEEAPFVGGSAKVDLVESRGPALSVDLPKRKKDAPRAKRMLPIALAFCVAAASIFGISAGWLHRTQAVEEGIGSISASADATEAYGVGMRSATDDGVLNLVSVGAIGEYETVAIQVNGETVALCQSQEDAEWVLQQIKDRYPALNESATAQVAFKEEVAIVSESGHPLSREEALIKLTAGASTQLYVVQAGDTAASIASAHGMTEEELKGLNPAVTEYAAGTSVQVKGAGAYINVVTTETTVAEETVAYEKKTQNTSTMYKGESKVSQKGVNGTKEVTTVKTYCNGQLVSTNETEKVTKEAVAQITLVGTKKRPSTSNPSGGGGVAGAPSFIWPVNGARISSPYGYRIHPVYGTYKLHTGVDLGCAKNTPIYAAASGTVVYKGYNGGYGNLVVIQHSGGYYTFYAHMNSYGNISKGSTVSRGQVIGYVGMTGTATGYHLHFEVRTGGMWGATHNPLPYLP